MSYEFKKLSEVNIVEIIAEDSNFLIESNGEIVRTSTTEMIDGTLNTAVEVAMGNIVEAETAEEVSETANVLVEDGGSLKRVPASAVGGSAGGGFVHIFGVGSSFANAFYECEMDFNSMGIALLGQQKPCIISITDSDNVVNHIIAPYVWEDTEESGICISCGEGPFLLVRDGAGIEYRSSAIET